MTCFDINPTKGSEAGVGWNFAYGMSKIHEVHVIAAESRRTDISAWMQNHKECSMKMFYIKSDFNWTMVKFYPPSLYKYINKWERLAADLAKRLDEEEKYDIVHKVTLTGFRSTGYLDEIGKPVVWGPIGGFQMAPWCLLPSLGLKAFLFYGVRNILNVLDIRWNKRVRSFASQAYILAATQDAQKAIKKYWKCDSTLMPEVGFVESVLPIKVSGGVSVLALR